MSEQSANSLPALDTAFRIGSGKPVPARILRSTLIDAGVELVIELEPAAWSTVDMVMLFHLEWGNRHEGEIVEGGPVQIELRLDADLVGVLEPLVDPADSTGATIGEVIAGLDIDDPLRRTEAWYALSVTEAVPLPPSLAQKGEVRTGFTTIWNDD